MKYEEMVKITNDRLKENRLSVRDLIETECPSQYGYSILMSCKGDREYSKCEKCWKDAAPEGDLEFFALKSKENVNHPTHYQGKNECIDVMRAMFGDAAVMHFCMCNAFKYRFRSNMKNGDEDIKKAEWYESYLMEMKKRND